MWRRFSTYYKRRVTWGGVIVSELAHDEDHQLIIDVLGRYKCEGICD